LSSAILATASLIDHDRRIGQPTYRKLFYRTLLAVALCIAAVFVCYFWIDRPVAFFIYHDQINKIQLFRWLTYPPPEVQTWSPLILTVLMVRRAWGPFVHWQKVLLVACLSLIVADEFRTSLGDVFGRYWPETWSHDNPSLIGTGTYGFHPFQHGDDIGSFPSGHAARILGFATVWLITVPRSRAIGSALCAAMLVSLVAMNYHFVSDVIAGSILGGIVAMYAVRLARFGEPSGVAKPVFGVPQSSQS
jgi:membrane-associated phospholipid phosphatase